MRDRAKQAGRGKERTKAFRNRKLKKPLQTHNYMFRENGGYYIHEARSRCYLKGNIQRTFAQIS